MVESFSMDNTRDESCFCKCHSSPNAVHIIACCQKCNFCKRNIAFAYYSAHIEECGKKSLEYFKNVAKKH